MVRSKRLNRRWGYWAVLQSLLILGILAVPSISAKAASSGTFALTGSLNTARYQHTATLLKDGQVLVTGGLGVEGVYTTLASAELYNPSTGKWTPTGSMSVNRTGFTATLLENGEVLVAGGSDYEINCWATAELYNPSTGEWSLTGSMTQPRCLHSATLLSNGDVLVSGGVDSLYDTNINTATVTAAEIYNPSTGKWTATGSLNVSRASAATLLLENGEVLSAGGYNNTGNSNPNTYLTSAELFDPATGTWNLTGSISGSVGLPTNPVLLSDGDVLIAGFAQIYNSATGSWTATGALPTITFGPTKAAPLADGNVLGTGNECKGTKYYSCHANPTAIAFLYNFSGNSWSQTGSMYYARFYHTMTLLPSGKVLVAGGIETRIDQIVLSAAELYTP